MTLRATCQHGVTFAATESETRAMLEPLRRSDQVATDDPPSPVGFCGDCRTADKLLAGLVMSNLTDCQLWQWVDKTAVPGIRRDYFQGLFAELAADGLVYVQREAKSCTVCGRTEPGWSLTDAGIEYERHVK